MTPTYKILLIAYPKDLEKIMMSFLPKTNISPASADEYDLYQLEF